MLTTIRRTQIETSLHTHSSKHEKKREQGIENSDVSDDKVAHTSDAIDDGSGSN